MAVSEVLNPARVGLFAWQVWSHKVLRWLVLPFVIVAVTGCLVAMPLGLIYQIGAWGALTSVGLAGLGAFSPGWMGPAGKIAQGLFYFYLVNLAAVLGVLRAITGRVETVWVPERG